MQIHLLVIGQSNVANHGNGTRKSGWGKCFHDGSKLPLKNPVPGGSGNQSSVWPYVGDLFCEIEEVKSFSVTLCAKGGTSINDWASSSKTTNSNFFNDLPKIIAKHENITHVFFHQGERDTFLKTNKKKYLSDFKNLKNQIDKFLPKIPWIVSTCSYRYGIISNEVRDAQKEIQSTFDNCFEGPDTDLIDGNKRRDNCHFNEDGLKTFANQIVNCLIKIDNKK